MRDVGSTRAARWRLARRIGAATICAALCIASLGATGTPPPKPPPPAAQPNVLVVVLDDQDCHSMGPAFCSTMNPTNPMPKTLSWLGDGGVSFSNFYADTPLCCQSRANLMTGQYGHNNGVQHLADGDLLRTPETMQAALRGAGYRTFMAGKYLNAVPVSDNPPFFDRFTVVEQGTYYDSPINDDGVSQLAGADVYSTTLIADRTVDFITTTPADQPLYAYVAFTAPHYRNERFNKLPLPEKRYAFAPVAPWIPPQETDRSDKPPWVRAFSQTPTTMQPAYKARTRTLYSVDDALDRVHQALIASGRDQNTLVAYVSDNGYLLGEHGMKSKMEAYQPSLRVPGIISWPGHIPPGTIDSRLSGMVDIAPTVYAATGVRPPTTVDGRNLLDPAWQRPWAFAEYWRDSEGNVKLPGWKSLWNPSAQYIRSYADDGTTNFRELYDLQTDPDQMSNLGTSDPGLDALIDQYATCAGDTCP